MKSYLLGAVALSLSFSFPVKANPRADSLFQSLPTNVGIYVRVPSLLGLAGDPKGNLPIDKAMATKAHQDALAKLRLALPNMAALPENARLAVDFLLAEQVGPLEIAVLTDSGMLSPVSKIVMSVSIANRNASAFEKKWAQLSTQIGAPMVMDFDSKAGLVRIAGGMGATLSDLSVLKSGQRGNAKLVAANDRIDQSGLGFLMWIDGAAAAPMLAMAAASAKPEDAAFYKAIQGVESVAFGWGTQSGFGRMGMDFYLKDDAAWADYLPKAPMNLSLETAGEPDWVMSMAIPTLSELPRWKRAIARDFGEKSVETLQTGLNYAISKSLSVEDLFATFGPELLVFGDETGDFMALRMRDQKRYRQVLAWLKSIDSNYVYRNGIHKALIAVPELEPDAKSAQNADTIQEAAQLKVLKKLSGSLLFWVEEGDWLVFASTPQALRDRRSMRPSVSIQPWLKKGTGSDGRNALLRFSAVTEKMAMRTWHGYLAALAMISDVSEANIDLAAIPSARELAFPKTGHADLSVEHEKGRLSFALRYQNWPSDALMGQGGLTGIAAVAIVAAVALPAYQDYQVRAKISSAFLSASAMKSSISESYAANKKLPSAKSLQPIEIDGATLIWTGEHIEIAFADTFEIASVRGLTVALAPVMTNDGLDFRCGNSSLPAGKLLSDDPALLTTVSNKHLPSHCRGEAASN